MVRMNKKPRNASHATVMAGASSVKAAALSNDPVARKNATAMNRLIGSSAMICSASRAAPTSEYGLRVQYAARMKNRLESVSTNTDRSRLPPPKKMPPASTANASAHVM